MERIRKAVIPAAGMGKRFYPLTRAQPKEMLPILDKPVIHYVVQEAVNSGLDEILIIVGYGKDAIINYFDRHPLDDVMDSYGISNLPSIFFVRQKEQKGLADAVRYAESFVSNDPFVVLLGDTIYESPEKTSTSYLLDAYYKYHNPCISVEKVPKQKVRDYGIVDVEPYFDIMKIKNIVEKPEINQAPSDLGATGAYVLDWKIFEALKEIEPGKNGEYQLADAFNIVCKDDEMLASMLVGKRYDIGTKELWVSTFIEFAKRDNRFKNLI
ncbi:MAG: UTP--glucose-1-phosphate uridylyltransferase [Cuniculiplasma sp.]|jgi:UTP--glucose-1-phosphate uridylyltransferase